VLLGLWACDSSGVPPAYRAVTVPELRLESTEAQARGRTLFEAHCSLCHGERADGRGPRRSLSSQPADFSDPAWRARMSPRRVFYVVREGVHGTAMPAWKGLSEDDTWDVVAFVLSVAEPNSKR